jgi:hypothetical protein
MTSASIAIWAAPKIRRGQTAPAATVSGFEYRWGRPGSLNLPVVTATQIVVMTQPNT